MPAISQNLENSLHGALALANEYRHEYATLEHLLYKLTEDDDAVAVVRACGVDLEALRRTISDYFEREFTSIQVEDGADAKPTASFQRAVQRAIIHVQSSGREEVTPGCHGLIVDRFLEVNSVLVVVGSDVVQVEPLR